MATSKQSGTPHCVVVGAGLAGLASAVWLTEAGWRVTLLERRGSLGGRTIALPQPEVDDVPDNGQHVFASGYEHLFRYLDSVGTRAHVHFPGRMTTRMPGGAAITSAFWGLAGLRAAFGDLPGVPLRERPRVWLAQNRLVRDVIRLPADLDEITAAEWFDRVQLPQSARDALWDGLVIGLTGDKTQISAARIPAELMRTGARQAWKLRTPISIGYPTVDLDTLFVHPAEKVFADNDVEVRTGTLAERVLAEGGAVTGVRLRGGEVIAADAVISAANVWMIGDLLAGLPEHETVRAAREALTPVPIVSVNLYLDRALDMSDWGEILYGGEGVLEQVWDRQRMHGRSPARNWFYSTTVSAAYDLVARPAAEIVATQMEFLARYYPAAAQAQVVHSHVVKMPKSTFAQRPGSRGVRPPQRTSVRGLALAGDWTRTDWTTTMEGACQSAARAVEVVLGSR